MAMELLEVPPTEKVYLRDTYLFSLTARVLSVIPDETADAAVIVLDRTIFHPQGGGQPSDVGTMRGPGEEVFRVKHVRRAGRVVEHVGAWEEGGSPSWPPDTEVALTVEEDQRLAAARCHSAGHALDVAVARLVAGAWRPSKGYHFLDGGAYVEYIGALDAAGPRDAVVEKLNEHLAAVLALETPTEVAELPPDEAQAVLGEGTDLSHITEPTVRVVTVAGGGTCPCGGTHVASTAELQGVTVTKVKAKKGKIKVSYRMA